MGHTAAERALVAPVLAAVAGFVDAVGYISLDLFTAHMSGNSARLGVYVARHAFGDALVAVFAVAMFVASIVLGTALMELGTRARLVAPEVGVLLVQAVLLAAFTVAGGLVAVHGRVPHQPAGRFYALVACVVVAMGLQTSSLQRLSGRTIRTTFVSGMLTTLADTIVAVTVTRLPRRPGNGTPSYVRDELGIRGGEQDRVQVLLIVGLWTAYAGGAIGGAVLHGRWALAALWVPIGVLFLLCLTRPLSRTGRRNAPEEERSVEKVDAWSSDSGEL